MKIISLKFTVCKTGEKMTESFVVQLREGRGATIGREDCEFILDHQSISRNHALVWVRNKRVIVTDLNSSNGIISNGVRVKKTLEIRPGERFKVGVYDLKFISMNESEATTFIPYRAEEAQEAEKNKVHGTIDWARDWFKKPHHLAVFLVQALFMPAKFFWRTKFDRSFLLPLFWGCLFAAGAGYLHPQNNWAHYFLSLLVCMLVPAVFFILTGWVLQVEGNVRSYMIFGIYSFLFVQSVVGILQAVMPELIPIFSLYVPVWLAWGTIVAFNISIVRYIIITAIPALVAIIGVATLFMTQKELIKNNPRVQRLTHKVALYTGLMDRNDPAIVLDELEQGGLVKTSMIHTEPLPLNARLTTEIKKPERRLAATERPNGKFKIVIDGETTEANARGYCGELNQDVDGWSVQAKSESRIAPIEFGFTSHQSLTKDKIMAFELDSSSFDFSIKIEDQLGAIRMSEKSNCRVKLALKSNDRLKYKFSCSDMKRNSADTPLMKLVKGEGECLLKKPNQIAQGKSAP